MPGSALNFSKSARCFITAAGMAASVLSLVAWSAPLQTRRGMPRTERHESRHEIDQLEDEWRDAVLKGDTAVMNSLLADDYMSISAFGTLQTKDETLASASLRQGAYHDPRCFGSQGALLRDNRASHLLRPGSGHNPRRRSLRGLSLYPRLRPRSPWAIGRLSISRPARSATPTGASDKTRPSTWLINSPFDHPAKVDESWIGPMSSSIEFLMRPSGDRKTSEDKTRPPRCLVPLFPRSLSFARC